MQTTPLPFQVSGANALAQPQRNAAAGVQAPNAGQFGATLSREIAQRQQAPSKITGAPMPAPSPASANKPAAPARQQAAEKPAAQGPKAAAREPAKQNEAVADAPATAQSGAPAKAEGTEDAAAAAESASAAAVAAAEAAASPVTDMLAFMASLAQPAAAVAVPVAAEATAAATGADVQLAALQSAFAKLDTLEVAVTTGDPALATATEGDAGFSLATGVQPTTQESAELRADLRTLQQTAQAAVQGDPKSLQGGREAAVDAAAIVEAPAPAATQLQAQAAKLEALAPAAVPADRIPARVGTQAWDNQVSQRIVYMVGKEQAATLTLNPPDLGPVQVVLNVSNEGTSVAFSSNELQVRQALENALPRLREMMSESGIMLGNATVDAGTQEQRQAQDGERRNGNGNGRAGVDNGGTLAAADDASARPATRTVMLGDNGMVDTFA
ncbi:flagellar hook-length control protein FliK [Telluria aromaticivorans]|uniref:Flagellar hook-length control protein-like C-terminal domain-containing protein n=1 Tax=Telluria aromaticivorans TaxID=2725995 RepID=A0A7Y2NZ31_9BURK|nr:flagellar hook-length control protein FliK [Telluria aromaticivorans]NNG22614.1 hypothetical protein [Telluria aromaticivorans]